MTALSRAIAQHPTRTAAAEAWGISRSYLHRLESGRAFISVERAVKIEELTGVSALKMLREQLPARVEKARNGLRA